MGEGLGTVRYVREQTRQGETTNQTDSDEHHEPDLHKARDTDISPKYRLRHVADVHKGAKGLTCCKHKWQAHRRPMVPPSPQERRTYCRHTILIPSRLSARGKEGRKEEGEIRKEEEGRKHGKVSRK